MNPIVIILAIIVIILVVVLYYFFANTSTTLSTSASLKAPVPPITPINNPLYVSYSYGIWVYINTWDSNSNKVLFRRDNNVKLYLDPNTPTLKCDVSMTSGTDKTITITDNFPIQKWTHVIVSLDNQFMDIYLDGKLVMSQRLFTPPSVTGAAAAQPKTPPDNPAPIYLGNSGSTAFTPFDAYIATFIRWTKPMDPQLAWNTYMSGNGGNSITNMFSSYNLNLSVLKNNVQTANYSLY